MDAMDAKTAVSIIIPFYNGIDWLEMIFVALGKQTFKDFEVIVADDGSREDVVARLEELMARQPFPVTHLWQEDCGFRKNRMLNKAVVQSRAEYLIFLDGDCIPHRKFVEEHCKVRREGFLFLRRSAGGMALATLPWVVYFGVHGALGDWFTAYFYDNLFLYKGEGGGLPALAQHLWWAVRDGLPAALLLAAFLLWALLTRRFAAAGGVAALAAGLAATSLMGGYLVYYGLVLAVFAPLGLVPLVRLAEKTPAPVRTALPWAVLAACAAACYALTPNRALRGRARADLPQYSFAAQINGGSLLNYGTLDGGFYTAAGVLPPCKYFCVTNMPLDDQWTDQQAVLKAGAVDYVVALTGDLHGDFPQYAVIDRCSYDGGEGEVTWYLYQLQR